MAETSPESRVLEPDTVTILTTHGCNAKCRHCSANSGPERKEALSWPQLDSILNQVFESTVIRLVAFAGGEPLLLGDTLLRAIRKCKDQGLRTRMVTNAYWATSPEEAQKTVRALREAGLDELNISTDDYHLPFVSLGKVHHAFEAAAASDFMSVCILNTYGPQSWLTPERLAEEFGRGKPLRMRWDPDGESTEHEWSQGETLLLLSNRKVLRLGRGIEGLADSEIEPGADVDTVADEIGGCPLAIRSAAISPRGHLVACCSIEAENNEILDYGDLATEPLTTLLDRAENDLITNMIATIGPPKIKQILQQIAPDELDFPRKRYQSYCDVCEDLVGRPANRRALYRHQAVFADSVIEARSLIRKLYTAEDGRVRVPIGVPVALRFNVKLDTATPTPQSSQDDGQAPPQPRR